MGRESTEKNEQDEKSICLEREKYTIRMLMESVYRAGKLSIVKCL